MGVIGPNNQIPKKNSGRGGRRQQSPLFDDEEGSCIGSGDVFKAEQNQWLPFQQDEAKISEALSLFPQPKFLLSRLIQAATSTSGVRVGPVYPLQNGSEALVIHHVF